MTLPFLLLSFSFSSGIAVRAALHTLAERISSFLVLFNTITSTVR
jgi:hypothetical protein